MWQPCRSGSVCRFCRPGESQWEGDRSAEEESRLRRPRSALARCARLRGEPTPRRHKGANSDVFASLPQWHRFCGLIDALQNRATDQTVSVRIAEQARTPVRSHRQRLNFERQLAYVRFFPDFAGQLGFARRVLETTQPLLHQFHDLIANAPGPIIELERCSGKEAASREDFPLAVQQPVLAKSPKALESAEFISRADDSLDEDLTGGIDHGALQIFFGTKVCEQATLADSENGSQLSDGQPLEAFE